MGRTSNKMKLIATCHLSTPPGPGWVLAADLSARRFGVCTRNPGEGVIVLDEALHAIARLSVPEDSLCSSISISPDLDSLAVAGGSSISVYNVTSGEMIASWPHRPWTEPAAGAVLHRPDGLLWGLLRANNSDDVCLAVMDVHANQILDTCILRNGSAPFHPVLRNHPDGKHLLIGCGGGHSLIEQYFAAYSKSDQLRLKNVRDDCFAACIHPAGDECIALGGGEQVFRVSIPSFETIETFPDEVGSQYIVDVATYLSEAAVLAVTEDGAVYQIMLGEDGGVPQKVGKVPNVHHFISGSRGSFVATTGDGKILLYDCASLFGPTRRIE